MKKLILNWLFGINNVREYVELLRDDLKNREEYLKDLHKHREALIRERMELQIILNLIAICENHKIDYKKELRELKYKFYPCDEPHSYCPYDAQCYEDCRVHCGLGENE